MIPVTNKQQKSYEKTKFAEFAERNLNINLHLIRIIVKTIVIILVNTEAQIAYIV